MKYLFKLMIYTMIVAMSTMLYVAINIVIFAKQDQAVVSDAAIVLGAAINDEQPSPVFRERINHSVTLYQTGMVKQLIFTGGFGKHQTFAESEVARNYAIKAGVLAKNILIEKVSTTTHGNLLAAKQLMTQAHIHRVLIVSDPLHMKRAMTIATDLGLQAASAPTPSSRYQTWSTQSKFLARETYFYIRYKQQQLLTNKPSE